MNKKDDDVKIKTDEKATEDIQETEKAQETKDIPEIKLSKEEESFKDKYLRARADLDNIQRRMREERGNLRSSTLVNFMKDLLPFIDNLDRALKASDRQSELAKGLVMSRQLLDKILNDNNIKTIKVDGLFDAQLHEAVSSVEDTCQPNNSIANVLETGYILSDRVIRYSKVQVTTGGPEKGAPEKGDN